MAIFEKQICTHCGKEIGALDRIKLKDGSYICYDCSRLGQKELKEEFIKRMTATDFEDYLAHLEANRKKLTEFNATDVYFDMIYVDMDKGELVFDPKQKYYTKELMIEGNPEVFEGKDLLLYNFFYNIKSIDEGVFSSKTKADVKFTIAFNNRWYPYAFNGKVLKNHMHKTKIKGFFNRTANITENEKKTDLEAYLICLVIENQIQIPEELGGKFTMNYDFEQFSPYFTKLFELKKLGVYESEEFDDILIDIAPSMVLRSKIKKQFKK